MCRCSGGGVEGERCAGVVVEVWRVEVCRCSGGGVEGERCAGVVVEVWRVRGVQV